MIGEAFYRMSGNYQNKIVNLDAVLPLADLTTGWQYAYGPAGFAQHSSWYHRTRSTSSRRSSRWIQTQGHYSFLNVLKLFGPGNRAPLSFPMAGWNVAMDFPNKPGVNEFLNELDDRAMEFGGRVYAAQGLPGERREVPQDVLPRIDEWIAVRRKADPNGVFASDRSDSNCFSSNLQKGLNPTT